MISRPFSKRCSLLLIASAVGHVFTSTARADRDVFLASSGGRVVVGSASDASPSEPDLTTRVFERVMIPGFPPFDPADYGLDEPGFFALPAGDAELPAGSSALPSNAAVTVNLLPFTIAGNNGTLFYWNGVGAVDFAPISLSQPGTSLVLEPNPIGSTGANGGADIHPAYRLDLSGAGVPTDGVYLISLAVSVAGLADSDRFFSLFLVDALVTDEDDAEELLEALESGQLIFAGKDFRFFQDAAAYVHETLVVPEPSSLALVVLSCVACGLIVRRRPLAVRSSQS